MQTVGSAGVPVDGGRNVGLIEDSGTRALGSGGFQNGSMAWPGGCDLEQTRGSVWTRRVLSEMRGLCPTWYSEAAWVLVAQIMCMHA